MANVEPVSDSTLAKLRQRLVTDPQTHGWPGHTQHRFHNDDQSILIWDSDDQADWFLAADSTKSLEALLRSLWEYESLVMGSRVSLDEMLGVACPAGFAAFVFGGACLFQRPSPRGNGTTLLQIGGLVSLVDVVVTAVSTIGVLHERQNWKYNEIQLNEVNEQLAELPANRWRHQELLDKKEDVEGRVRDRRISSQDEGKRSTKNGSPHGDRRRGGICCWLLRVVACLFAWT